MSGKEKRNHERRVKSELTAAGMTKYGHLKLASRYLYHSIRAEEHVMAVVYGRYSGGEGQLVATDQRILFLNKMPLFEFSEDISYEVLLGVTYSAGGLFASVNLHTRLGDFYLCYAPKWASKHFVEYVGRRLAERGHHDTISRSLPVGAPIDMR